MHVRTSCQTVYPVANTIKKLYKRTKRRRGARTIDEVEEEYFPAFKVFIDSSEQEIPRPKNKRKEKGRAATTLAKRRKKYTIIKTQYIMVNGEGTHHTTTYYCTRQVMIEEEYIMIM